MVRDRKQNKQGAAVVEFGCSPSGAALVKVSPIVSPGLSCCAASLPLPPRLQPSGCRRVCALITLYSHPVDKTEYNFHFPQLLLCQICLAVSFSLEPTTSFNQDTVNQSARSLTRD